MTSSNIHTVTLNSGKPELSEEQYAILDHRGFDRVKVDTALKTMRAVMPRNGIKTSDHEPCTQCGNVDFIRTGVCFTCLTCGDASSCG